MRKFTMAAVLAAVLALGLSATLFADGGALDGKTFAGKVGDEGKTKGKKDNLVFKDGKFTSTDCGQYGFKEAGYTATTDGALTKFEAEAMNEEGAKMKWTGTVDGKKVTATAVWSKEGEPSKSMWFKGALKAGKKAKKAK